MLQCLGYMVKTAWRQAKSVLGLCAAITALKAGMNLLQLYVAPTVLEKVESRAAMPEVLGTIGFFTAALFLLTALNAYAEQNAMYGRIDVRTEIMLQLNRKASTTAYPHTRDPQVIKLQQAACTTTEGNSEATENIWHTLIGLGLNLVCFGMYLTVLTDLNPVLLAVVLATTAASFFVSRHVSGWEYRHREEKSLYLRQLRYIREKTESITLAKDIRIFGLADWMGQVYEKTMKLLESFLLRREKALLVGDLADLALALGRNVIAYVYLIRMALDKGLPASRFLLYFSAVSGFTAWVNGILTDFTTLHKECLDISQVLEYLHLPEPFRFEDGKPVPKAEGYELRLEKVSFRYPGTEKYIIKDMDLTIRAGEKVAIVGLNGAGKTTLVRLLCGYYDPEEGRVLLNGEDIRQYDRREYYKLFSAVFQEFFPLDVTVAENVAQSAENIDMDRVKDCVEKAGLTEMVASLPQGLSTHVGRNVWMDGVLFSGGQMQRLMLARALYKDGPILVLDEPTAALDPIAEDDIYRKYNAMTAGKTSVFISHRLASTRFCDRILFLAEGRVAEEGTHQQLLDLGGQYAELFQVQSRYYQEGVDENER